MKVLSIPQIGRLSRGESGIHTVVRKYYKYAAQFGIEFVEPEDEAHVIAVHAGMGRLKDVGVPIVSHLHGLYWTSDYQMDNWAHSANQSIVRSLRQAAVATVPSGWVAQTIRRDLRINPIVLPHGIDVEEWQTTDDPLDYSVIYAKNRAGFDVCDPSFVTAFAQHFPGEQFAATFAPHDAPDNVTVTGQIAHSEMQHMVKKCKVYISTTKETFGIGILEALAAGVPVLAFNEGGAKETIQHGINGYLAQPENYDDLYQGFVYCMQHRAVLGANAAETAKQFTWEKVMGKLAHAYELATSSHQEPSVSVVIPVYNKSVEELRRAVDSALNQTYPPRDVIIVDDGSDGTSHEDYIACLDSAGDSRITLLRQPNSGVATARNLGISRCSSKYVVCLDADDWIDPRFLEACVPELEADASLGAAYTGLQWHKPDGSTGLSLWPEDYDYDRQLKKQNQVPTCSVFRRDVWERLGGYRQRYAPTGAGTEDAEFYLRMGAMGYAAKKVTTAGLFHYSWMSGHTAQPDYREVDWLAWHPWVQDRHHPISSVATPMNKIAHPVRQYDTPIVSVVIPVGPGHSETLIDSLDSLEAQTFRQWEAVVVWDDPISDPTDRFSLEKVYPHVNWRYADMEAGKFGERVGTGAARNIGVNNATAPFILFLDADDWLYPTAIEDMIDGWIKHESAIYGDYSAIATVKDLDQLSAKDRANVVEHNPETGATMINYTLPEYDEAKAMEQPENPPFIWCNVTTLIPTAWHHEIGGFDETMQSWEDVDYWYRLAWSGKPFKRIAKRMFVYRFNSGTRRETGIENWDTLLKYMEDKKADVLRR